MNSRIVLLIACCLMALAILAPTAQGVAAPFSGLPVLTVASSGALALAGQLPKNIDIDIDINTHRPWYRQPAYIWIGVGVLVLLALWIAVGRGRITFSRGKG